MSNDSAEAIAIIGMAGRFPGAKTLEDFWQNLQNGVESISFFTDEELESTYLQPSALSDPNYVKAKAILENVEMFDAAFFGFTPREAEITDPQHRIFLECAWEALENAGYDSERYEGPIGLFAGVGLNTYLLVNLLSNLKLLESLGVLQTFIRNRNDHLTTHTSYKLNLNGPSVTVQTACSTSLVAVHLACQSLLNRECDMTLAGGVTINVPQKVGYLYQEGGITSPDGHCRVFDAKARGTVGGNGAGIVVLKRLEDALRDGDHIEAVIKGSAINNDGSLKVGYTAPSVEGQSQVIKEAQLLAGVEADTISYIETHGTGTPLGDPIEIAALSTAFGESDSKQFCAIGSVKSNIGHLDTAAGVAGLIKTVLALKHKLIPPSLHFEKPNPAIDFDNSPFYVNASLARWENGSTPRRAGISSFGIGGTNAHLILEEAPPHLPSTSGRPWHLLLLSAKNTAALDEATANLLRHLADHPDLNLADVAYTLQVGRRHFNHRRVILCKDREQLQQAVERMDPQYVWTSLQEPKAQPVFFMFPGQGSQYFRMGGELYQEEPFFRAEVDRCARLLKAHTGYDIREEIFGAELDQEAGERQLRQTALTQPALFITEYALAQTCMQWGVRPDAMIGHSLGEYVAACLAGVLKLEDALKLVATRGQLMQRVKPGAMLVVPLAEKQVQEKLRGGLSLAAVNGPSLCVVSGPEEEVSVLEEQLKEEGLGCRRLETSHAFHSGMMDEVVELLEKEVGKVERSQPQIRYVSNVTGKWITSQQVKEPSYWAQQMRHTVRFSDGLTELFNEGEALLLEVGPGRGLMSLARWHAQKGAGQVVLRTMKQRDEEFSEEEMLTGALGKLWLAGVDVRWEEYYANQRRDRLPLPTYPFERQRYWIEPQKQGYDATTRLASLQKKHDVAEWFYVPSWQRSAPPIASDEKSGWLVFVDEVGLGAKIIETLQQRGERVISVKTGEQFSKLGENAYEINPKQRDDYDFLLADLRARNQSFANVAHLWSVTPGDYAHMRTEKLQELGFFSLLYLVQVLGEQNSEDALQVVVVTNDMQEVIGGELRCPEKATVLGACKVIPQEYPKFTCRSIDVTASDLEQDSLVELLVDELSTESPEPVVAYRRNHRWVQLFQPTRLTEPAGPSRRLKPRGVYLITGGLGGVGLVFADYLARTVQAGLALVGRSIFPAREEWDQWLLTHEPEDVVSRQIQSIRALEEHGARVLVLSADVANEEQMQAAVAEAQETLGHIDGVIHAAGIAGGGMIQLKTQEMAANVLAAKVNGTRVLENIFSESKLDWLLLCSSRSSIIGGFGQIDYCAANNFLDAFAHYYTAQSGTYTVSVNWDAWQDVGMLVNTAAQFRLKQAEQPSIKKKLAHPLLDECIDERPGQQKYATELSVAGHWALDDHRIVGTAVMPGTAYMEMARAALPPDPNNRMVELRDVFFLSPLAVRDDEKREVRISLEEDGDSYQFHVTSAFGTGNGNGARWQEYSIGKIGYVEPEPAKKYDLKEIIERCQVKDIIIGDDDDERDPDLGPRWQSLNRVYLGHNELLAILELPEEFDGDMEILKLHPALLDRATGTAKHYLVNDGYYLPMSYRRLRIKEALPRKVYTYIKYRDTERSIKETITFDIVLLDEDGVERVEIEGFSQKRVNDAAGQIKAITASSQRHVDEATPAETAAVDIYQAGLKEGISPKEGAEAFNRILAGPAQPQIVVSTKDLQASIEQANQFTQTRIQQEIETLSTPRASHPRPDIQSPYVAPTNALEQSIADIWQEMLGVEQVGINDNFFELGGDSVQAIQIAARVNKAGLQVTPQQLFEHPTIADLASVAGSHQRAVAPQGLVSGELPLTPIQHWFFSLGLARPEHWNQSLLLELRQALDPALLPAVLEHLLRHHDALRLRFEQTASGWRQFHAAPTDELPFSRIEISSLLSEAEQAETIAATADALQRSLDLEHGPVVRMAYFEVEGAPAKLLLIIHHLVVDGVSWRILLEDLETAYRQLSRGEAVTLPAKTTSFQQWAERLMAYGKSEAVLSQLEYWRGKQEQLRRAGRLPLDEERGANTEGSAASVVVGLSVEETTALLQEVPGVYHTQINDVLVTGLGQALSEWSGQELVALQLEGHGREALFAEVELTRTVGWLTTHYPVVLKMDTRSGVGETLKRVKEELRTVPGRGLGYGVLRYLSGEAEVQEWEESEVKFNYLGQLDQMLGEEGLYEEGAEGGGAARDENGQRRQKLEVTGYVRGGQLQVEWSYSENLHQRATIEAVAENFIAALRAIITHCQSAESGGYTPSDFPLTQLNQNELDAALKQVEFEEREIGSANIEDVYPLSPAQEGMLFHSLYTSASEIYVTQITWTWQGMNVPALEWAWQQVMDRHPALRTAFVWDKLERPHQLVGRKVELSIEKHDWSDLSDTEQQARLETLLREDSYRGYKVSRLPLMRVILVRLNVDTYQFIWSHHHLLLDGWSIFLVLKEVLALYESNIGGQSLQLEPLPPYREYIAWLGRQDLTPAKVFWQEMLKGFTAPTPLKKDLSPDKADPESGYQEQRTLLSTATTNALQKLARQHQLTMNTLVQGAWAFLLSHYGGTKDVAFGATVSGRPASIESIEYMVGLFINVLPMRVRLLPDEQLVPWLKKLQKQQFDMRQYEYTPLIQVQRWSDVPRGMSLFESILTFENYPVDDSLQQQSQSIYIRNVRHISRNNYPLTIIAGTSPELSLRAIYDTRLFSERLIKRLLEQFTAVLQNLVARPEATLQALEDDLVKAEKEQLSSEQKKRAQANLSRFKQVAPKPFSVPAQSLIKKSYFKTGELPLIIEPAIEDVDVVEWARGNREFAEQELSKHGAILFRNFNVQKVQQFEQVAQALCSELFGEYGDLPREGISGKIYGSTPYPSDQPILFHNESSHTHRWPMKIWFYCVKAAHRGGETPIVDCRKVFKLLKPETIERLREKKLMYVRNFTEGLDVSWEEFYGTSDRAAVEEFCRKASVDFEWKGSSGLRTRKISPAIATHPKTGEAVFFNQLQLHHVSCLEPVVRETVLSLFREEDFPRNVYYGDGSSLEACVIDEIGAAYENAAIRFRWQEGDILMLDNMLVAHGRERFAGPRKIVVAMGDLVNSEEIKW